MTETTIRTPPVPLTEPAPAPGHGDDDFIHTVEESLAAHWWNRLCGRIPRALCGVLLICDRHPHCRCGDPNLPPCPACAIL